MESTEGAHRPLSATDSAPALPRHRALACGPCGCNLLTCSPETRARAPRRRLSGPGPRPARCHRPPPPQARVPPLQSTARLPAATLPRCLVGRSEALPPGSSQGDCWQCVPVLASGTLPCRRTSGIAGVVRVATVGVRGPRGIRAQWGQDAVSLHHGLLQQQGVKLDRVVAVIHIYRQKTGQVSGLRGSRSTLGIGRKVGPSSRVVSLRLGTQQGSPGRALSDRTMAASPVIRAGYQRPSCCLARHAEPACRELKSGSWKGRSSSTETTCPWENLPRQPQGTGAQTQHTRASEPSRTESTCLGAPVRGGGDGRQTDTHVVHRNMSVHTRTHTHTGVSIRTPARRTHRHTHPRAHSHLQGGSGNPEDQMLCVTLQLSGPEQQRGGQTAAWLKPPSP